VLNEERRRLIVEILNREGRVLVGALAKHFPDLPGHHSKRSGHSPGAWPHPPHPRRRLAGAGKCAGRSHFAGKRKLHRMEKSQIAAAAARMVREGQVVILDSRTTTTAIARALREFENLTIITNAVNIAAELSGFALEVILTGGTLRKNSFSLVGPIAEETLRRLNADILFLGVDGFDVHYGLSTPSLLEAKSIGP
jgi:DeoR family transcriptional regulator of aga operon